MKSYGTIFCLMVFGLISGCNKALVVPGASVLIEPLDCSQESRLMSTSYEVKSKIAFRNASNDTVVLRWINYEGVRDEALDQIVNISPGATVRRNTFLTHPFVVTDTAGECIGIYLPQVDRNFAVVE